MKLYMKQLVLLLAVASAALAFQGNGRAEAARWQQQAGNVTIVRDDWGIAHVLRKNRRRRRLRHDVRAGRGRLQSRRDELPQRDGAPGGGGGRIQDLSGPADEAVHRPGGVEEPIRGKSGVAEDADECLRRRAELLPCQASRGEAASDPALRAMDGAFVHGGQHRRRHRAGEPQSTAGVLRQGCRSGRRSTGSPRANRRNPADRTAWPSRPSNTSGTTRCC